MNHTEQMLVAMAAERDQQIEDSWKIYWKHLEALESGDTLDAAARAALMKAAEILGRKDKMIRDSERIRKMLQARDTLAKVTPERLAADQKWIEAETAKLNEALAEFQKRQTPKAIAVQERQQGWEQGRAARGQALGEIERFKLFIDAGPDSPAAQC